MRVMFLKRLVRMHHPRTWGAAYNPHLVVDVPISVGKSTSLGALRAFWDAHAHPLIR